MELAGSKDTAAVTANYARFGGKPWKLKLRRFLREIARRFQGSIAAMLLIEDATRNHQRNLRFMNARKRSTHNARVERGSVRANSVTGLP